MNWGMHEEVLDGSGDPWRGPERAEGPRGGPGRVGGPSERSGMSRGILREARNGWLDTRGGLEWVGNLR